MITRITFEKFNKYLLLAAFVMLIYRKGNFSGSFMPKPFEILLFILILLTVIYLIKENKIKDFFLSIPKNIWIATILLVGSVFLGWFVSFCLGEPSSFNMVLEVGTFGIGIVVFFLTLFYTKDDEVMAGKYLYALLFPAIYVLFVFFPWLHINLFFDALGKFLGLTLNPNIISKTLLIPAMFFITYSLFENKSKWIKIGYILVSTGLVALLFWISSRGAILSLFLGCFLLWLVFSLHNFSWKRLTYSAAIILLILSIGFTITPSDRKQVFLDRTLNLDIHTQNPIQAAFKNSESPNTPSDVSKDIPTSNPITYVLGNTLSKETRFKIWSVHLRYILWHPLGIGPNTHLPLELKLENGQSINLGPHNTYLQIWLWGGILGLASFLYVLFQAFKNLKTKLKSNFNPATLVLTGILLALCVSFVFDDSLSFYWFFIILALSLGR